MRSIYLARQDLGSASLFSAGHDCIAHLGVQVDIQAHNQSLQRRVGDGGFQDF